MDKYFAEDLDIFANEQIKNRKDLENKTFFITGATGLVGSYLVKALCNMNDLFNIGISVLALVRNEEKGRNILGECLNSGCELVLGDILNPVKCDKKIDYIIHCAAVTNSKQMVTYPVETIRTAIDGTENILLLAKEKDIKSMVYISSMEMYGSPDPSLLYVKESDYGYVDCLKVRSSYPEGKRISECLCASYASEYGVPVKIARLAQTFGAGVSKSDTRVFAQFARSLINSEDIVLHTKGESYGNYCYTRDCANGIMTILLKGNNAEAYNVTNEDTNTTIAGMAKMICEKSGGKIEVVFDIPKDSMKYGYAPPVKMLLSSEKLRSLGWEPQVSLPQMYDRLIGSWQSTGE
ncbi:MAG: NAD-dependent epimerase/dehydratase family protein [Acutalibacteraceae bacterium]